ncbi:MAG: riboflavin synthase [Candidatus Andersenbacteria bacterium]
MFTGIIRHLGTIENIRDEADGAKVFSIGTELGRDLQEGDSVAVNGACLTVLSADKTSWQLRLMRETLAKTNLGTLAVNSAVNLERPLVVGDRLDGHFVQGHVDGVCKIVSIEPVGNDRIFTFQPTNQLTILPYLVSKGSVALDGVSLTVVEVNSSVFTVSIMPYTLEHTTFGQREIGDTVNIEVDMIGKYVLNQSHIRHPGA